MQRASRLSSLHHLHGPPPHLPLSWLAIVVVIVIKYVTSALCATASNLQCAAAVVWWHFTTAIHPYLFSFIWYSSFRTMLPLFYSSFFPFTFLCVILLFKQLRHFNCFQIRIFALLSRCADTHVDTRWHAQTHACMCVCVHICISFHKFIPFMFFTYIQTCYGVHVSFHVIAYNIICIYIYVHMYILSACK